MNTGPSRKRNVPCFGVEDDLADDVGRHEVGRELHAGELEVERPGERLHEQRLGHAGHALEQHVAAHEQRGDEAGQRAVLADDDLADLLADGEHGGPDRGVLVGGRRDIGHGGRLPRTSVRMRSRSAATARRSSSATTARSPRAAATRSTSSGDRRRPRRPGCGRRRRRRDRGGRSSARRASARSTSAASAAAGGRRAGGRRRRRARCPPPPPAALGDRPAEPAAPAGRPHDGGERRQDEPLRDVAAEEVAERACRPRPPRTGPMTKATFVARRSGASRAAASTALSASSSSSLVNGNGDRQSERSTPSPGEPLTYEPVEAGLGHRRPVPPGSGAIDLELGDVSQRRARRIERCRRERRPLIADEQHAASRRPIAG